ncbi:MAG: ABC transporter permease [Chloroflexota bacterium]
MFPPRWKKVARDLWGNVTRTSLVVLSIAVGVFALGMILTTNVLLSRDLSVAYDAIVPAHAEIYTQLFDTDLMKVVEEVDGVEAVYARRNFRVNLETGPDEWTSMSISFYPDFENIEVNKIFPVSGAWPPGPKEIIVERSSLPFMNAEVGDTVVIETRNGRERELTISGIAHDVNIEPTAFTQRPNVYADFELLDWLGEEPLFDELFIRVENDTAGAHPSPEQVKLVSDDVRNKLEKGEREVYWIWMPTPGEHPATEPVNAILLILGVLGGFSLFLSGFLVVNIINSILSQQVKQIGIMKAIGARSNQVFSMYIMMVLFFGLLSLLIAVPAGALAGYFLASYLAGVINFDLSGIYFSPQVIWAQFGVGVAVPMLAALVPVIRGASVSVREAISERGMGRGQFGTNVIDQVMSWLTIRVLRLSRPMSISLRNTIRRKARLILTLVVMTLGGVAFISVISVYSSLLATMDDALAYFSYDVEVDFDKAYRIEKIDAIAAELPEVVETESWIWESVRRVRPDGSEGPNMGMSGVPVDTSVINPTMIEGRWLAPGDRNAVVINSAVLSEDPDIKLGDRINFKLEGDDTEFVVVGIARSVMIGPIIYINRDYLGEISYRFEESGGVQIVSNDSSPEAQAALAQKVEAHFESYGLEVTNTGTINEIRENIITQFNMIVVLLAVMAVLITIVGGLGRLAALVDHYETHASKWPKGQSWGL